MRLLAEPVAAALAYRRAGLEVGSSILVYDLGGGTFDLALLRDEAGSFELAQEPRGLRRCGGDDFDRAIYDYCEREAQRQWGQPLDDQGLDLKFLRDCRQRKENLSARDSASFSSLVSGGRMFRHTLRRDIFEGLIQERVEETIRLTGELVRTAKAQGHPVETMVLIGGSSRIPLVQRRLEAVLPVKPRKWQYQDVAVALGAAYFGQEIVAARQRDAEATARRKAEEEAKRRQLFEPEMVAIPAGTFMMGSPETETHRSSDERQHQVTIKGFEMAKTPVTQRQWKAVMGNNPSRFQGSDNYPVEKVSWNDAMQYIEKLNARTGGGYRLPTEAEWEYAGRGGRARELYCGGNDLDAVAWHEGNSGGMTHPVCQKAPNGYGLYDMSGNVWEWTCSEYGSNYGGAEQRCQTSGGAGRVLRGGSWDSFPWYLRAAFRTRRKPDFCYSYLGFRLARTE